MNTIMISNALTNDIFIYFCQTHILFYSRSWYLKNIRLGSLWNLLINLNLD